MGRAGWICLVSVVGCGRIDFDPLATPSDGMVGGDAIDAVDAAAACTNFGPWGAPQPVPALETAGQDWGPEISADGLTLYFNSPRAGSDDIYVASRPDRASAFGSPVAIGAVDSGANEGNPTVSGDQLEMYFDTDRAAGYRLFSATRANTSAAWSNLTQSALPLSAVGAYLTPDGLSLYYGNGIPTGPLFVSTRAARTATFQPGAQVPGIVGTTLTTPSLTSDELTMFWGGTGAGPDLDIFTATRPDLGSPFGLVSVVSVSMAGVDDNDPSISADGTELFFSSARPGGAGANDIYVVTRPCLD